MSRDRLIGPPIDGLAFIEHLGSGGYSDVYLYERRKPRMRVAVKVLTDARLSESELAQFAAEAETMAELADHPYIVQVFNTGTTDDGRPYLVMKYYPPPNLGQRAASEQFTVAEVLRTGIQIASAVETAHRAGILHRDIKPANILVGQYGVPGLADFGIAGQAAETDAAEDLGVSIPWSPPEVLTGASNGSVASDVYSLAATLWHLLAGRSPFEIPRGDNSPRAFVGRILRSAPPTTGRGDVPASLERLLQQAMAKAPQHRPASAADFGRALQMIEQELRYARTDLVVDELGPSDFRSAGSAEPVELLEARPAAPSAATFAPPERDAAPTRRPLLMPSPSPGSSRPTARPIDGREDPATRLRPAVPVVAPAPPTTAATRRRAPAAAAPASNPTTHRPTTPPVVTPVQSPFEARPHAPRRGLRKHVALAVGAGLVVVAATVGVLVTSGGSDPTTSPSTPPTPSGTNQGGLTTTHIALPRVSHSYDASAHRLTFSWTSRQATATAPIFSYDLGDGKPPITTTRTSVTVQTTHPSSFCIVVGIVAPDGTVREPSSCVPGA